MPREIRSSEEFERLAPTAHECRVVRAPEYVKLKLRTPEYLYVYKTTDDEASDLLKNLKDVEVVEINPVTDKEKRAKGKKSKKEGTEESEEK